MIGDSYAQNRKVLKEYYADVQDHGHALWRGISMTEDDCLRRDVIKNLICNFRLDYSHVERQYGIVFADYFADDLKLKMGWWTLHQPALKSLLAVAC